MKISDFQRLFSKSYPVFEYFTQVYKQRLSYPIFGMLGCQNTYWAKKNSLLQKKWEHRVI